MLKPLPGKSRVGTLSTSLAILIDTSTAQFYDLIMSWHINLEYIFAAELSEDKLNTNFEKEISNRISRSAELEDLQGPRDPAVAPLSIKVWLSFKYSIN